jgi:hypothetical protein
LGMCVAGRIGDSGLWYLCFISAGATGKID